MHQVLERMRENKVLQDIHHISYYSPLSFLWRIVDALKPFTEDPDGGKIYEHSTKVSTILCLIIVSIDAVYILNVIQASGGFRVSWRASSQAAVSPGVHRTQSAFLPKSAEQRGLPNGKVREL